MNWVPAAVGVALSLAVAAPVPVPAPAPPATTPAAPATPPTNLRSFGLYYYWFQGDERAAEPGLHVRDAKGALTLTDIPLETAGPWFSGQKTAWHKQQLKAMARANIDSALVVYRADAESQRAWAVRGLDRMVAALKELQAEQQDYPLVSLFLDTTTLGPEKLDLTTPAGQDRIYGVVQQFFLRVPDAFRLRAPLPDGRSACVLMLGNPSAFVNWDNSFLQVLRKRFTADFGLPLAIITTPQWSPKATDMDAMLSIDPSEGLHLSETGKLKLACISPGFNDGDRPAISQIVRPRLDARAYIDAWNHLANSDVDWVVINSWDGFHNGTEVAPSLHRGAQDTNLTMAALSQLTHTGEFGVRTLRAWVPTTAAPRAVAHAEFLVRNTGSRTWDDSDTFVYARWMQGGTPVGVETKFGLGQQIPPRRSTFVAIGAGTVNQGQGFTPGDYHLQVFLQTGVPVHEFRLVDAPIHVATDLPARATLLSSDMPVCVRTGQTYQANVRIRNDGSNTWTPGAYSVACSWTRYGARGPAATPVLAPLTREVPPGDVADVEADVPVQDSAGKPLTAWKPGQDWTWALQWQVIGPKGPIGGQGFEDTEIVEVNAGGLAADFPYGMGVPAVVDPDQDLEVKAAVRNLGPADWKPGEVQAGVHWYYSDGIELAWSTPKVDVIFPLGKLAPQDQALVRVKTRTPPFAGRFYVELDLAQGGQWASSSPDWQGAPYVVASVAILKGPYHPVNLASVFDTDGISSDANRADGDLDGHGHTFPAEFMPPDAIVDSFPNDVFNCGRYAAPVGAGLDSSRQVIFTMPDKSDGARNFVACRGQKLEVSSPHCSNVHVLAAPIVETSADFTLFFDDGTTVHRHVQMTDWTSAPKFGEHVGFYSFHRHSPTGDEAVPVMLHHYAVPADSKKTLVAIGLPDDPDIKVMAITLEAW